MFDSNVLDFAIGLVFTFLAMSLAAGAATEAFASFLKTRSTTLLQGVKDLLNDPNLTDLASDLYKHALINPRASGNDASTTKNAPAYIDPDQFAAAFLEIMKGPPQSQAVTVPAPPPPADFSSPPPPSVAVQQYRSDQLKAAVDKRIPPGRNEQIRTMLHGMIDRAKGDEEAVRKALSSWFDNAMDRVSGVYKRWTQVWSFVFAFAIAAALNVSTIDVAKQLWLQPVDTKALIAAGNKDKLDDVLPVLNTLPIGWPAKTFSAALGSGKSAAPVDASKAAGPAAAKSDCVLDWACWLALRIAGWAITAFATVFGAPFWFDALQQIVRLKGAGPSPAEKGGSTAAAK